MHLRRVRSRRSGGGEEHEAYTVTPHPALSPSGEGDEPEREGRDVLLNCVNDGLSGGDQCGGDLGIVADDFVVDSSLEMQEIPYPTSDVAGIEGVASQFQAREQF